MHSNSLAKNDNTAVTQKAVANDANKVVISGVMV